MQPATVVVSAICAVAGLIGWSPPEPHPSLFRREGGVLGSALGAGVGAIGHDARRPKTTSASREPARTRLSRPTATRSDPVGPTY